jgi:hypothetical protein
LIELQICESCASTCRSLKDNTRHFIKKDPEDVHLKFLTKFAVPELTTTYPVEEDKKGFCDNAVRVTKLASLIFQVLVGQKKKASFPCCKTRATRVKRVEKFYLFPVFQESLVGAKMVARWGDLFLGFLHLIEDNRGTNCSQH